MTSQVPSSVRVCVRACLCVQNMFSRTSQSIDDYPRARSSPVLRRTLVGKVMINDCQVVQRSQHPGECDARGADRGSLFAKG